MTMTPGDGPKPGKKVCLNFYVTAAIRDARLWPFWKDGVAWRKY